MATATGSFLKSSTRKEKGFEEGGRRRHDFFLLRAKDLDVQGCLLDSPGKVGKSGEEGCAEEWRWK